MGNIKVDPNVDGGKWYELKRSGSCISQPDIIQDIPNSGWRLFPSKNIPTMFNYGHVYYYLVESINAEMINDEDEGYEGSDDATAKPLRKGRLILSSGFVVNIQDNTMLNGDYLLRAHVHHSMKNTTPLNVCVHISLTSGSVKKCTCTCAASALGRCAHVTTLLLHLSDYVKENGHEVDCPVTSKPCEWSKGKKRVKEPKALHQASYSSLKRNQSALYNFDPRPIENRGMNIPLLNDFVRSQKQYAAKYGETPMWLNIFKYHYDDFDLDDQDVDIYYELARQFAINMAQNMDIIQPSSHAFQVDGTIDQSKCDAWFRHRQFRITASKCKTIYTLGETLDRAQCYTWLRSNLWFKDQFITFYMQYGLSEEPNAVLAYSKVAQVPVTPSGSTNKASPGLIWFKIPHFSKRVTSPMLPSYKSEMKQAPPVGVTAIKHFIVVWCLYSDQIFDCRP